ncbi:hypothetical protein HMPREF1018_01952 [Bacteroides fragilis]|nr:hypothetical protein HMPREF1018_01952 [Bacteroides fragilis]
MTVSLEVWRYLIGNTYLKELLRFSIGYFISGFFSLLTMVLVNKSLLPVQMGEYAYLKSILDLLVTVLGLNLYDSYLRFNSIKCNVGLVKKVQAILFLSLIVFMIVIYCLTNDFFCIIYSAALLFNERVYFFRSIIATKKIEYCENYPVCYYSFNCGSILSFGKAINLGYRFGILWYRIFIK